MYIDLRWTERPVNCASFWPVEELQGWWWFSGWRYPTSRCNNSNQESTTAHNRNEHAGIFMQKIKSLCPSAWHARLNTHRADVQVMQAGHLQPFTEEMLLHTGLCLEDGQRNGSDGDKHKRVSVKRFCWYYKVLVLHKHLTLGKQLGHHFIWSRKSITSIIMAVWVSNKLFLPLLDDI